jgi:1-hydroxycarotenoid 3,4-desaturase
MNTDRAVVVGAGIGGLTTALLLALRGVAVTVVEKELAPGGKARMVPVGDSAVDGGPTVFTMRDVFDEIFADAGSALDEHLTIRRADILARHAWDDGPALDLYADLEDSVEAIGAFAGPKEAAGFRRFMAEARHTFETLDTTFMRARKTNPLGLTWRIGLHRLGALYAIHPYTALWTALGAHFRDPRLRQLFGRYATYCGSSPFRAPATLMLIAHVEQSGVWLIEGGVHALARALETLGRRHGVDYRYGTGVSTILADKGRAAGVELATGERIAADLVVVNADPAAIADGRFGAPVARAVRPVAPASRSLSAVTFLMEAEASGRPLVRHNVFFSPDYAREFADIAAGRPPADPTTYVCALDADARSGATDAGRRFQIIVNAPANGDRHIYSRGDIETCTTQMLGRLAASGLTLTPHSPPVVVTPSDFERLFPSTGGALYGRASHGWAASFLRQSSRTRIPGLYCAGGSTHPGAGVPMAALSGRLAASTAIADLASTARSRRAATSGGTSTPSPTRAASA